MTGILSRYRFANGTGRYVMTIYRLALLLLTVLQNQNLPLDLQCTFDIDNLPVRFGSLSGDGTVDRARMNNAIRELAEIIWKKGGFRFCHRGTNWASHTWTYFCSQDENRATKSVSQGKIDAPRMNRFSCNSRLTIRPSLGDRTLAIKLRHMYHMPYTHRQLSPEVVEFVQARVAVSTSAEIYRDLQASRPLGWDSAEAWQVYYLWQQANSSIK
jgi:hypothetical protein